MRNRKAKITIKEVILRWILPIAVICLVFFSGMYYAASRDIRNGRNYTWVNPGEEEAFEGYYLQAGEVMEQRILVYHDFDGVSLLLDHSVSSMFRTVRVSLVRESTGETVLDRTLPVWLIRKGQYTFFASKDTIPDELPEFYRLRVESGGIGGGLIYVAAGEMPFNRAVELTVGGRPCSDQLLFGIVTDYQRTSRNCILTGIAVLLLCAWLVGMLAAFHRGIRISENRKLFFATYFSLVGFCALLAATYSRTVQYTDATLGGYDGSIVVTDDSPLDLSFVIQDSHTAGLFIDQIDTGDRTFSDETVELSLTDVLTGQVVQQETYRLADLDPEPAVDKLDSIYFAFDDRYNPGTKLMIHIAPKGLFSNGISFGTSSAGAFDSSLYVSGEKENFVLSSRLSQYSYSDNIRRVIFLSLAAAAFGLFLLLYSAKKRIPLLCGPESDSVKNGAIKSDWIKSNAPDRKRQENGSLENEIAGSAKGERGKLSNTILKTKAGKTGKMKGNRKYLPGFLLTAGIGLLLMEWAYSVSVAPASRNLTPAVSSLAGEGLEWNAVPDEEHAIAQTFTAEEANLSGIGIELSDEDLTSESISSIGDMTLHVMIEGGDGSVLSDQTLPVSELRLVNEYTNAQYLDTQNFEWDEQHEQLVRDYRAVLFPDVIRNAKGQSFTVRIFTDSENPGRMLIAQKPQSQGGAANLLTLYPDYTAVIPYYFANVLPAFAFLLILYVLTRKPERKVENLFLVSALGMGLIYSFVIPAYYSNDEMRHIDTVYYLTNQFFGDYQAAGNGYLFERAQDAAQNVVYRYAEIMRIYRAAAEELFRKIPVTGNTPEAAYYFNVLSNSNGWTYLPATIGMSIARGLDLSLISEIMFARWGMLIVSKLLIFLGIRKCPIGKRGLAVAALFPMVIHLTSSVTYDAMILGFAFLFIGYAMHVLLEKDSVSVLDWIILVYSAILLLSNKQGVYFPVVMLVLLLPLFRKEKKYRFLDLGILGAGIVFVIVRMFPYLRQSALTGTDSLENGSFYTIGSLLANPGRFLHILETTTVLRGDKYLSETVGNPLGFNHLDIPYYVVGAVLVICWIASHEKSQDRVRSLSKSSRILIGVLAVLGIVVYDVVFLISMTGSGAYLINGLVGRYFIPYALLIILAFAGGKRTSTVKNGNRLIFGMGWIHFFIVVYAFFHLFARGIQ